MEHAVCHQCGVAQAARRSPTRTAVTDFVEKVFRAIAGLPRIRSGCRDHGLPLPPSRSRSPTSDRGGEKGLPLG